MFLLNRRPLVAFLFLLSSLSSFGQQSVRDRLIRPIDNQRLVRLKGSLPSRARGEFDQGPVSPALQLNRLTIVFQRTAEQEAALQQLLSEQHDTASANYHKWLTPSEFGEKFGVSQHDLDIVTSWLLSQGFSVEEISPSHTSIAFSGIAAQVEASFHTQLHRYKAGGALHYAPAAEPYLPESLAAIVSAITSLNDFHPHPHVIARHPTQPHLTSSISGNHFLIPGDLGTIYNLPDYVQGAFQSGLDGSGQTIAIVGQTQIVGGTAGPFTDIDTFRSVSNLPPTHLQVILGGTDPGVSSGDIEEANLDIQWAGSAAPNANIVFVYSADALGQSLAYIVNHVPAQVVSTSYGDCEANISSEIATIEGYLKQANAEGMTVVSAAGDNDAADCDGTPQNPTGTATHGLAVDYPASSVYVTAMGGTQFDGDETAFVNNGTADITMYWNGSSSVNDSSPSAFSYIPEKVWNDLATSGLNLGTGGGASSQFAKPSWQQGVTPSDGHRDIPDLSLTSSPDHDGYLICSQGSCQTGYRKNSDQTFTVIGGTSAAAPIFAGIMALADQKLAGAQGNINPAVYSLAAGTYSWAFHDIITGDNIVQCGAGSKDCPSIGGMGYSATVGYDQASGWGTVDASAFINALAGTPQPGFSLLPALRNFPAGFAYANVAVVSEQGFSGSVTLTCSTSSSLPGIACQPVSGPVTPTHPATIIIGATTDTSASYARLLAPSLSPELAAA